MVHSFSARRDIMPNVNNRWHYHPEVELVYFKKGNGTQFIGDCITQFNNGDVVLVGSNLPHYWQFDESYFDKEAGVSADVSVIHFNENFWGDAFLLLPETQEIKNVLKKSKRGIQITGGKPERNRPPDRADYICRRRTQDNIADGGIDGYWR